MKLHCLGTAGYHPNDTRHTTAFFIPEANLLFDAGTGVFRLEHLLRSTDLSVLLTHAHLDHVIGLTYFLDLIAVTPVQTIHLYGEAKKLDAIKQHIFHKEIFPAVPPFRWHPFDSNDNPCQIGQTSVSWFPLEHPGGSIGYRLQLPGVSLAFVTDTTSRPDSSYWSKIQGVDWLIHECNFRDEQRELAEKTGHSWTSAVLENAYLHGIQRLILMHIDPLETGPDPIGLAATTAKLGARTPPHILLANDSTVIDLSSL